MEQKSAATTWLCLVAAACGICSNCRATNNKMRRRAASSSTTGRAVCVRTSSYWYPPPTTYVGLKSRARERTVPNRRLWISTPKPTSPSMDHPIVEPNDLRGKSGYRQ